MQIFQDFGALIESRWRHENYNEQVFPQLAAQALTESNLPSQVDPWEIIRWVQSADSLPDQKDAEGRFGDPPITLYSGPRFYVDVYFWLDGTTSIHQHAFTGAFQVLLGSSVHSRFRFEQEQEMNPYFLIGNLSLQSVSLLAKGDTRQILPGHEFIHSLFHLDRPSATITVRSNHSPSDAIQYSYLNPYISYDPFFEEDSLVKKIQTVSLLLSMKHPEADRFIEALIHDADFQTTFSILKTSFEFLGNNQ